MKKVIGKNPKPKKTQKEAPIPNFNKIRLDQEKKMQRKMPTAFGIGTAGVG